LTLKNLEPYIEGKLKKFKSRISMMMPSIICLKTRLELWQAYARCYFDYFMPAIALCDQTKKFQSLYTTSLKKALHLPLHLPNQRLLELLRVPSLNQIAGHHVVNNARGVVERYQFSPESVQRLVTQLENDALQYANLKAPLRVARGPDGKLVVDILEFRDSFEKNVVGLGTGVFLNIRVQKGAKGEVGSLMQCPTCSVPAHQAHFLNDCPANAVPRVLIKCSLPGWLRIGLIDVGDFNSYYANLRAISASCIKELPEAEEDITNLAKATAAAATYFVTTTLELFKDSRVKAGSNP